MSSITIPNIDVIRNEALDSLTKEFDLEKSLGRYSTVNPELIKLCESMGLSDEKKDASRALFVADYVFTESPSGSSEEDRRKDVIKMFMTGLERTEKGSEILVQTFHLAFKTASMMKRSDIFMAGRGIPRQTSLLILKDIFLDGYLKICSEVLGVGKCGFELAILAGALKKTFPSVEYEQYNSAPKSSDYGPLLKFTWKLLQEYNTQVKVDVNDQVVIPNIDKTSSFFCLNKDNFSSWNVDSLPADLKANKAALKEVNDFISQADSVRPLVYFRAKVLKSNDKFFLIRDPYNDTKPFLLLKTSADEVNVTEILTLLNNRGRELSDNVDLFKAVGKEIEVEVKDSKKHEAKKVDLSKSTASSVSGSVQSSTPDKKPGFFARLFGRGKKSETPVTQSTPIQATPPVEETVIKQEEKPKEDKPKPKQMKKIIQDPSSTFADFISNAISLIAVGDLRLFEIFDTYRESNYQFLGVLHSDFKNNSSIFKAHKKFTDARSLVTTLDGLDVVLEKFFKHFYGKEIQLMPEEILFTSNDDARYVMTFEGNENHLVGMGGSSGLVDDYTGKQPEVYQRRTLGMRTNQILNSLKSNRFSDAVVRVLGEEVINNTNEITYESAVLNIYK